MTYLPPSAHDALPQTDMSEFSALIALARTRTGPKAVTTCLRTAAALVEHAAYEMAQKQDATYVARLILLAADLERVAQAQETA